MKCNYMYVVFMDVIREDVFVFIFLVEVLCFLDMIVNLFVYLIFIKLGY